MPRLRNTTSGVVVNVDQATADRLGQGWESADKKSAETKAAPKGRASSKSEK